MSNVRLFLIDGHALVFKMYYAFMRRPMVNSKGEDMSILFGFTKYILELIDREKPTHIAVAFDPPGGTFRNRMFEAYKANRPPTPPLVIQALEPLTEIVRSLNIPVLMEMGYEADDVIGSMAKRSAAEGADVFMVTPDKDYGQLIDEHIYQVKPGKNGENEVLGVAEVCEKYSISSPLQVIEFLALCGDTADNVPGVKGVGEVGAKKLLSKYQTIEDIYSHLDELSAKQRENFEQSRAHIGLSHELVTIKTDMDLSTTLEDMALDTEYDPHILELFDRYEFGSLKRHIRSLKPVSSFGSQTDDLPMEDLPSEDTGVKFETVKSTADNVALAAFKSGRCSIVMDPSPKSIFSDPGTVTMSAQQDDVCLTAAAPAHVFRKVLEDSSVEKVGYDLKLKLNVLSHAGISLEGKLLDIELMHYLLNPEEKHDEAILAESYLGISLDEEQTSSSDDYSSGGLLFLDEAESAKDLSRQASTLLPLAGKILEDLQKNGCLEMYNTMEEPLIRVLASMERTGVKVDLGPMREFASELQKTILQRERTIREMAGDENLNVSSPKQIGAVLFEKLALDPKAKKSASGTYSTDEKTLQELSDKHPIIEEILEFRGDKKLLSTYIEPFGGYISEVTGKVHTTYNQALTATGRLSSSNPNLQNIPIRTDKGKIIRKAFVPSTPGGVIMSADYSQIELRIMAHLSCDQHLVAAFRDGVDVHAATASKIFGIPVDQVTSDQRRIAKTANFGILYGISAFGLSQSLKVSRSEAKKIIDDYYLSFPAILSYKNDTLEAARENGYVETIFGRRRYLKDINGKNHSLKALAERNAINAPIQGTSADIIKLAMIGVDRKMREAGLKSRMVLQIHDELVFDAVPSEIETLKQIVVSEMENVVKLSIPLTVECNYGTNWLEAH